MVDMTVLSFAQLNEYIYRCELLAVFTDNYRAAVKERDSRTGVKDDKVS